MIPTDSCIVWAKGGMANGYGCAYPDGITPTLAHRAAWEKQYGNIPLGYQLHHKCGIRRCVNTEHLELVTPLQHARTHTKQRTHCRRGHLMTVENTRLQKPWGKSRSTVRICRTCKRLFDRKRNQDPKRKAEGIARLRAWQRRQSESN